MKGDIHCEDADKIKPLDKLFDDQINEFESGKDKVCDKDLDTMIWELGDFENEEPRQEASEFAEDKPIEEELIEKRMIHGSNDQPYYIDSESAVEEPAASIVTARTISKERRQKKKNAVSSNPPRKKKK